MVNCCTNILWIIKVLLFSNWYLCKLKKVAVEVFTVYSIVNFTFMLVKIVGMFPFPSFKPKRSNVSALCATFSYLREWGARAKKLTSFIIIIKFIIYLFNFENGIFIWLQCQIIYLRFSNFLDIYVALLNFNFVWHLWH